MSRRAGSGIKALSLEREEAKERQREGGQAAGWGRPKQPEEVPEKVWEPIEKPDKHSGESIERFAQQFQANRTYVRDMEKLSQAKPEAFNAVMSSEKRIAMVNREKKEANQHSPTSPRAEYPHYPIGRRGSDETDSPASSVRSFGPETTKKVS